MSKIFHVEAEPIQALARKDHASSIVAEQLESALGVAKRQSCSHAHYHVEYTSARLAQGRLMDPDERAVERAQSDRRRPLFRFSAAQSSLSTSSKRTGKIGIRREDPVALGFLHSMAYRVSFATVARILKQTCKRMPGGELPDHCRRRVFGSVVHDQNLDGSVMFAELRHLGQSQGKPGSFVIGRNHDRKPGQNPLYYGEPKTTMER